MYANCTFKQSWFKQNFFVMNQVFNQKAKYSVKKDFYKLVNNSSFGYEYRSNMDNCIFGSFNDKLDQISYLKKYHNLFDQEMQEFSNCELLEKEIGTELNTSLSD